MNTLGARGIGRVVGCLLLGVLVGVVGTVMHRAVVLDVDLPIALVLCLLATASTGILARAWTGYGGLLGYGLGWVVAVQILSLEGPGGDVLVPDEPIGYVWIYGGLLVVAVVAFLPRRWFADQPARRARTWEGGAEPFASAPETRAGQFGTHA
ncbi:DUF6113 family protein [Oerskovia flava]|uniref:DUF6113 family protein n=1 Tax=Oerskovia flava TaxID=2986422 RepID=UPI002240DC99|nr:DUF6113 family protein [Oerskovia sp. JB1-3-2]